MDENSNFENGRSAIDTCQYLFAESVREIEELTLELMLTEAKPQAPVLTARDNSDVAQLFVDSRPIESDATCRSFRVVFHRTHLVSYTVLNESYGRYPEQPEVFEGKLFRIFSWSHLLEFIKRTTYACDEYPGRLKHYEIACLNHVVDVIATAPPTISIVKSAAQELIDLGGSQPELEDIPRRQSSIN